MRPSHAASVIAVREASFDQFPALAQQLFAFGALHSLAVLVDGLLLPFLARPMPLPRLLPLGNVGADAGGLRLFQYRTAVVSLVCLPFFLRLRSTRARSSRVGVSIPDSWANPFRNSS